MGIRQAIGLLKERLGELPQDQRVVVIQRANLTPIQMETMEDFLVNGQSLTEISVRERVTPAAIGHRISGAVIKISRTIRDLPIIQMEENDG